MDLEEIKIKLLEEIYLAEKSFFDLDSDDSDKEDSENTDEKDRDAESDENETQDEPSDDPFGGQSDDNNQTISIQFKLQLKIIFTSLKNMISLVKTLYVYNKNEFENLYDKYNRLYGYIKDFILYFNELDSTRKIKMIKLFREAFKLLNKKLYDKLSVL